MIFTLDLLALKIALYLQVRRKRIHPKFQFRLTQPDRFDIALLELVTEAGYSFHILPICLPESDLKLRGREAVVAGWGKTKPSTELMGTNILRSASVPILGERIIKFYGISFICYATCALYYVELIKCFCNLIIDFF